MCDQDFSQVATCFNPLPCYPAVNDCKLYQPMNLFIRRETSSESVPPVKKGICCSTDTSSREGLYNRCVEPPPKPIQPCPKRIGSLVDTSDIKGKIPEKPLNKEENESQRPYHPFRTFFRVRGSKYPRCTKRLAEVAEETSVEEKKVPKEKTKVKTSRMPICSTRPVYPGCKKKLKIPEKRVSDVSEEMTEESGQENLFNNFNSFSKMNVYQTCPKKVQDLSNAEGEATDFDYKDRPSMYGEEENVPEVPLKPFPNVQDILDRSEVLKRVLKEKFNLQSSGEEEKVEQKPENTSEQTCHSSDYSSSTNRYGEGDYSCSSSTSHCRMMEEYELVNQRKMSLSVHPALPSVPGEKFWRDCHVNRPDSSYGFTCNINLSL